MPRPLRQILPGHPNHIVFRGNNRRRLFSYKSDYEMFVRFLIRAHREKGCGLSAANIITNHGHTMCVPPTIELASKCMQRFLQDYASVRNRKREATGKLFEQRYYSKPITSELQLAYTVMYIDANAIRAGLVADAMDWRWSTYPIHAGEPERSAIPLSAWTPSNWYRGLGRTTDERAMRYRQIFQMYLAHDPAPDHVDEFRHFELLSEQPYRHRLRRPDHTRAAESASSWSFAGRTRWRTER
jgi:putative transposase